MADVFSKSKRSDVMSRIRSRGNEETELSMIRLFRAYKITGWRRNWRLDGKPDFVFPRERLVLFVDGCFWHCCPMHGTHPSSNQSYWQPKLERNKARDKRVTRALRKEGWRVLRVWHHELRESRKVAARVRRAISKETAQLDEGAKRTAVRASSIVSQRPLRTMAR
jgi:DNA mismatch endonuclease (patch repair protein)